MNQTVNLKDNQDLLARLLGNIENRPQGNRGLGTNKQILSIMNNDTARMVVGILKKNHNKTNAQIAHALNIEYRASFTEEESFISDKLFNRRSKQKEMPVNYRRVEGGYIKTSKPTITANHVKKML